MIRHRLFSNILCCAATLVLAGCDGHKLPPRIQTGDGGASSTRNQNLLSNSLSRVSPDRLGIRSQPTTAAMSLNEWFEAAGNDIWQDDWAKDVTQWLGESTTVMSKHFEAVDAEHIRTCLLMRAYAFAADGRNDRERAVDLFYSIVRDVGIADTADAVPVTAFEILLTGRGSAADRAWVFGSALRQLRIDAFIIEPVGKESHWLVGVAADNSVLLFDPKLGLAIPADILKGTDPLPRDPVSFADLAGESEILGGLSADDPYPLNDTDLQKVKIRLIGHDVFWAQRHLLLQESMAGDQQAVLCDPLQDFEDVPGLRSRVADSGPWSGDDIAVWEYPTRQLAAFGRLSEEDESRKDKLLAPFRAILDRVVGEVGGVGTVDFGDAGYTQFAARVAHLRNEPAEKTTSEYQNVRLGKLDKVLEMASSSVGVPSMKITVPDDVYQLHLKAAEDATLWVAAHLIARKNYQAGIDTLNALRDHFEEPTWGGHVPYLAAVASAETKQPLEAIDEISKAAAADPKHKHGYLLLRKRWESLFADVLEAGPKPAPKQPTEGPVNGKPDEEKESAAPSEQAKPADAGKAKDDQSDKKSTDPEPKKEEAGAAESKKADPPPGKETEKKDGSKDGSGAPAA